MQSLCGSVLPLSWISLHDRSQTRSSSTCSHSVAQSYLSLENHCM